MNAVTMRQETYLLDVRGRAAQIHDFFKALRCISGWAFARAAGWKSPSLVSMIELGKRTISAEHVRLWCSICGASERQTDELLWEQAAVARMWGPYGQLNKGGLEAAQRSIVSSTKELRMARSLTLAGFSWSRD